MPRCRARSVVSALMMGKRVWETRMCLSKTVGKQFISRFERGCLPFTLVHGKRRTAVITGSANLWLTASKHQLLCARRVSLARVLPPIRPEYPIRNTLVSHLYGKPYSFMVFNQTKATDFTLKSPVITWLCPRNPLILLATRSLPVASLESVLTGSYVHRNLDSGASQVRAVSNLFHFSETLTWDSQCNPFSYLTWKTNVYYKPE